MATMLPTIPDAPVSLADVLRSAVESLCGRVGAVPFTPARSTVVVLIDGLGARNLADRAGHARTLTHLVADSPIAEIPSGFPSTTVAQLTSLTTGVVPAEHGLVGYSVRPPGHTRVRNLISGWLPDMVPEQWQPIPTLFETLRDRGIPSFAYGPSAYAGSAFSRAFLRGAEYRGVDDLDRRMAEGMQLARRQQCVVYIYASEVDGAGHHHGWQSTQWSEALERVDAATAAMMAQRSEHVNVCITADHGMVDVESRVDIGSFPGFAELVAAVGGEPRCPQLYLHDSVDAERFSRELSDWLPPDVQAITRSYASQARWFGAELSAAAWERVGDVLVPCLDEHTAAYDVARASAGSLAMRGQHGSLTERELFVPCAVIPAR